MTRLEGEIPIDEVLSDLGASFRIIHGTLIKMKSHRYKLFKEKGCQCVSCGVVGSHFTQNVQ